MIRTLLITSLILLSTTNTDTIKGLYIEELITSNITGKNYTGTGKLYITEEKALLIEPGIPYRIILDYKEKKAIFVNDRKKTRKTTPLNTLSIRSSSVFYNELKGCEEKNLLIRESGNEKKINSHNCFEVIIFIPKIAVMNNIWLTKNPSKNLGLYFSFLDKAGPDIITKKLLPIMKKYNAIPVYSVTTIVRPKGNEKYLRRSLRKISFMDIQKNLFAVPEDYTVLHPR